MLIWNKGRVNNVLVRSSGDTLHNINAVGDRGGCDDD